MVSSTRCHALPTLTDTLPIPHCRYLQFGKKLQAAMVRKLQESDVTTQWSLNYKLNSKLRMQFNITSAPPFPKTLMFQYSSEGNSS